jgi:AcrR family transcriptional regulator
MPSPSKVLRPRTASTQVGDSLALAALDLLEEQGLDALTVRGVAARAGVAPMGVYSRFGSKDGLLEALFVHGFATLQDAIETPPESSALSRLRTGCMGYRDFTLRHPQLYHLMFEQMMVLQLSPEALEGATHSFDTLVDRVAAAMQARELTSTDPVEVAQQVWAAMHGAVSLEIAGVHLAADREASYSALIDALLIGLGADNRPSQGRNTRH